MDLDTASTVALSCLLEMVLSACNYTSRGQLEVENMTLKNGLSISESNRTLQTTVMVSNDSSNAEIAIHSFLKGDLDKNKHWISHAQPSVLHRS